MMKRLFGLMLGAGLVANTLSLSAATWINDNGTKTDGRILKLPSINTNLPENTSKEGQNTTYEFCRDVAQYKMADWSNLIGRARNVTVDEAKRIADANPEITFFFYVKGGQMVLENNDASKPYARVFHHGDAVFFSGSPWWGSAPGLADGYIKKNAN